ncbi:MAG: lactate racemase domain-containing protein, partial [Halovenus sp.]
MGFELPLGTETVECSLPSCRVTTARPPGGEAVDVREAARDALRDPHGPPLTDRIEPSDSVSIVVTDVTRATPEDVLLDVLVAAFERAGVDSDQISVVIGLGLHRPMTDEEIESALGEHADLAVNHDPDRTVTVGEIEGCPVELFEPITETDVLCSTGMVEPHQYAGFSGGAKTALIGAGGESQLRYTHGPEMLARDGV